LPKQRLGDEQTLTVVKQLKRAAQRPSWRERGCESARDLRGEGEVQRDGVERRRETAAPGRRNGRLKKLVADLSLNQEMLKAPLRKTD